MLVLGLVLLLLGLVLVLLVLVLGLSVRAFVLRLWSLAPLAVATLQRLRSVAAPVRRVGSRRHQMSP